MPDTTPPPLDEKLETDEREAPGNPIEQPRQRPQDCGFTRAGLTDQTKGLSPLDRE